MSLPPWPLRNDEALEAVGDEVLQQTVQQIEIHAWLCAERAGEIHVMMRIAQPRQRRDQEHAITHRRLGAADELVREHAVGENRHVAAVLLQRGHGEHHRRVAAQRGDLVPFQIGELHGD
jgi:hypothetical protein